MDSIINIAGLMSDAFTNPEKLPVALISCGIVEAAAALGLLFFKPPAGIFLQHGKAPVCLYYVVLAVVFIFGVVEAFSAKWVSADRTGRHAAGKTILCVSILLLIIVLALGGLAVLTNMK